MTATTNDKKWQAGEIGPRQLKQFNSAISDFGWKAKEYIERTDYGNHAFCNLIGGAWQPAAAPMLEEIKEKYAYTVTGANYKQIVADIQAATLKLKDTRPIIDKRTTPEERAERERIAAEYKAKQEAEAARLAQFETHEYSLAETSKAIKQVLGVIFPATTFSVRSSSYSGGCSIDLSWKDGPTDKQIREITQVFQTKYFDGMVDMEYSHATPEWEGHRFKFRGNYVSGSRGHSLEFIRECAQRFSDRTGLLVTIKDGDLSHPYVERGSDPCGFKYFEPDSDNPDGVIATDSYGNDTSDTVVNQMLHHTSKETPQYPCDTFEEARNTVFSILTGAIKPAAPEHHWSDPAREPITFGDVTVSENNEKNGVELRFASKPDRSTLDTLKAHGWRWSRFSSCWYKTRTPDSLAFAKRIAGVL